MIRNSLPCAHPKDFSKSSRRRRLSTYDLPVPGPPCNAHRSASVSIAVFPPWSWPDAPCRHSFNKCELFRIAQLLVAKIRKKLIVFFDCCSRPICETAWDGILQDLRFRRCRFLTECFQRTSSHERVLGIDRCLPPVERLRLADRNSAMHLYISYLQIAMFKARPNMELATGAFVTGRHWQQAMDCCHAVLFE